ncbi:hypothetical protein V8C86DRAFT_3109485 [Haematococcus lacustris]
MLTMEQRLGPAMTRCRVEGVLGFLGYCEAVQSVEIRLVMDEYTDEEPTYEQLPVGAWLAERLMANFPNCHVLGLKPFIMLDSELLALLSHQLVVGRIKHVDIQTAILTDRASDVPYQWVEPALGLTTLIATYLGPLPISLRDRTCNLVKLSVTEMNITDVGNLPQSVSTLLISDLSVVLPELNMAALTRGVADLSSGRFERQHIGLLGMAITSKKGTSSMALTSRRPNPSDWVTIESDGDFNWFHDDGGSTLIRKECHESCLATCECLVINIDSESIASHLSPRILAALRDRRHPLALQLLVTTLLGPLTMRYRVEGVIGLLGRCEAVHSVEIRFIDMKPTMEDNPTYEQLPLGAWLAERLMANFPKCLSLRLQDFQCQHAQLAELLSHSHFLGSLQNLDIQEFHIQDGSLDEGHYEWVEGYLGLTVLSTVYLGPVPTPLQPLLPHSKLMKLSLTETHITAISLLPKTIQILDITYLHVNLPEPDQQAMTSGVADLSSGRFKTLDIGFVGLTITSLEGGGHASLAALKPLVGRFKKADVKLGEIAPNGESSFSAS